MSNSLQPYGLKPSRLFCPWNFPSKNTGVGSHSLLQGIFTTQGLNPGLLHCRQILYCLSHQGGCDFKKWMDCLDVSHELGFLADLTLAVRSGHASLGSVRRSCLLLPKGLRMGGVTSTCLWRRDSPQCGHLSDHERKMVFLFFLLKLMITIMIVII